MSDSVKNYRIIGESKTKGSNHLLICIGGIHGNESIGIIGIQNFFKKIDNTSIKLKHSIIGIIGNVKAYALRKRFLDIDLNRLWSEDRIKGFRNRQAKQFHHEEKELQEIFDVLQPLLDSYPKSNITVLDFHTTSAPTCPFIVTGTTSRCIPLIERLNLPCVWDSFKNISGVGIAYFQEIGCNGFAIEVGHHTDLKGIVIVEEIILKILGLQYIPFTAEENKKNIFKLKYTLNIEGEDEFRLLEGFSNFDPIRKDQILGHTTDKIVKALCDGYIFMPSYDSSSDYGFHVINRISDLKNLESTP